MLEAEFEAVIAAQIRDAIPDIELAVRSANARFRSDPQTGKTTESDLWQTAELRICHTRIHAVSSRVGIGGESPNICGNLITYSVRKTSPKVIHPGGIRSPGPSSSIFLRSADTRSGPVGLQAAASKLRGLRDIEEAAQMVVVADVPIHLSQSIIERCLGGGARVVSERCS